MYNTFGYLFTLTTFGESHGNAIGGVVDGMPPGIEIDEAFIQHELDRRKPGQSNITTDRCEADKVNFLSGVFEGKSTGAPIGFVVENTNQHTADYDNLKNIYRPSHADYTYQQKYGLRDYRGGGRTSARITISRCVAGALAKLVLRQYGIQIQAYVSQVGRIALERNYHLYDLSTIDNNVVRCPDEAKAKQMERLIKQTKIQGDTIGGVVTCVVTGCPVGLGEPEFGKLHAQLGAAMLSINAAKGFEYGEGFESAGKRGSESNDRFVIKNDKIQTATNRNGGILGGISNGEDIYFRVAFKPVSTILQQQQSVDVNGNPVTFKAHGRHDPCVAPRAVPIVEAMTALVLVDFLLLKSIKIGNNSRKR